MVNIHCHVLPGIDDGSPDLATSVAMCKQAVEDGVTQVVGTPHCSDQYQFSFDVNQAKRAELQGTPEERFLATKPIYEAMVTAGYLRKCIPAPAGGERGHGSVGRSAAR